MQHLNWIGRSARIIEFWTTGNEGTGELLKYILWVPCGTEAWVSA